MAQDAESESRLLVDYGNVIAAYIGQGTLTLINGQECKCRFEAGQLANGQVILLCDFLPPLPYQLEFSATQFNGVSSDGLRLYSAGTIHEINYLPDHPAPGNAVRAAFFVNTLNVEIRREAEVKSIRFGLTNFRFIGTESSQLLNRCLSSLPLNLSSANNEVSLSIVPLEAYSAIMARIATLKIIDVTSEAVCELSGQQDIAGWNQLLEDLCYLLSVARGTKIQWVYCDEYDTAGKRVKRTHVSRITKSYCPLSIVDPRGSGRNETKIFIEQAYPVYVQKRDLYRLHKGTIDAYLDAKAEHDFLEMRGVKLAVAMEILKSVFLALPDSTAKEFVLEEDIFKSNLVPLVQRALDDILLANGVADKTVRDAIANVKKICGLNRRAFRYFIEKLSKAITLKAEQEEIALFVKCRDKLIHQGRFYVEVAQEHEIAECPPKPSKEAEYYFIVNFIDRIFLKLLGYSGPYIDWRQPGGPDCKENV